MKFIERFRREPTPERLPASQELEFTLLTLTPIGFDVGAAIEGILEPRGSAKAGNASQGQILKAAFVRSAFGGFPPPDARILPIQKNRKEACAPQRLDSSPRPGEAYMQVLFGRQMTPDAPHDGKEGNNRMDRAVATMQTLLDPNMEVNGRLQTLCIPGPGGPTLVLTHAVSQESRKAAADAFLPNAIVDAAKATIIELVQGGGLNPTTREALDTQFGDGFVTSMADGCMGVARDPRLPGALRVQALVIGGLLGAQSFRIGDGGGMEYGPNPPWVESQSVLNQQATQP